MTLFRCGGPPGSGKSTLTDSLCVEGWIQWFFRFERQSDQGSDLPGQRTKGIRCKAWEGKEGQSCTVMDLGGQAEFYSSHQVLLAANDVPTINAIVVSSIESQEELKKDVSKWASFFGCKVRPNTERPPLLLIATRSEKSNEQQKNNIARAYRELRDRFEGYFTFLDGPFFVDARKSRDPSMHTLKESLHDLREQVLSVRDVLVTHAEMNSIC